MDSQNRYWMHFLEKGNHSSKHKQKYLTSTIRHWAGALAFGPTEV